MIRAVLRSLLIFEVACALLVPTALWVGQAAHGDVIAYTLQHDYLYGDLYLLDLRTLTQSNLTHTPTTDEGHPIWSPDGSRIAYYPGLPGSETVCVYDGKTQCYNNNGEAAYGLHWMPDGKRIAYLTDSGFNMLDVNSAVWQRIHPAVTGRYWGWSRDGSRFIITTDRGTAPFSPCCAVFVGDGDLSNIRPVYRGNVQIVSAPDWSPNGRQVIFAASNGVDPTGIRLLDIDDGSMQIPTRLSAIRPTWSPDGAQIAFVANDAGYPELYLMNPDGSDARSVASVGRWQELKYAWSPDSTRILIIGNQQSGGDQVFLYDLRSKSVERIPADEGRKTEFTWRP